MAKSVQLARTQDESINNFIISGAVSVLQWAESAKARLSESTKTIFEIYSQAFDKTRNDYLGLMEELIRLFINWFSTAT